MRENIMIESKGEVKVIRIKRNEKKNEIKREMYEEMEKEIKEGEEEDEVRENVLIGVKGDFY